MAKNKTERYAALPGMNNVYFPDEILPGEWAGRVFGNDYPITLELACGGGEYTLELAARYPKRNFIGVDIKGERIYKGARKALDEHITNVVFLRAYIQFLDRYITRETDNAEEIWITFPDPYPKKSKKRKRLTSPFFLDIYRRIILPNRSVHLKTDSELLYFFTLDSLKEEGCTIVRSTSDLYNSSMVDEVLSIKTMYEKQHLEDGKTIKYVEFMVH